MRTFFFGCWREAGHYLHAPGGHSVHSDRGIGLPFDSNNLDGRVFQPRTRVNQELGVGRLVVIGTPPWTVLGFWDRSVDTRGNSCGAFVIEGAHSFARVLEVAAVEFPTVVQRLGTHWPLRNEAGDVAEVIAEEAGALGLLGRIDAALAGVGYVRKGIP